MRVLDVACSGVFLVSTKHVGFKARHFIRQQKKQKRKLDALYFAVCINLLVQKQTFQLFGFLKLPSEFLKVLPLFDQWGRRRSE